MGQPVLGLKVEYPEKLNGRSLLVVIVKIALGTRSKDFITSQHIRGVLAGARSHHIINFGKFLLVHDHSRKNIEFMAYYPHPPLGTEPGFFKGAGIASALETRVIQIAKGHFPNATHITHMQPSPHRITQLLKRGHQLDELHRLEIKEFEAKLRKKRVTDLLKAREKTQKSKSALHHAQNTPRHP